MTTELVLLMALSAFLAYGAFFNSDTGPAAVYQKSGPRLAAHIEQHLSTGRGFKKQGNGVEWVKPPGAAPTGRLDGR